MPKKNERPMTDAEIDQYVKDMQRGVTVHLDAIQKLLPPGYIITFVARHPEATDAHMILSKDSNLEAVADCILQNKSQADTTDGPKS